LPPLPPSRMGETDEPVPEPTHDTPPGAGLGLLDFTRQTYPRYLPAPHHRLIAEKLEAIERGEIKRLILSVPPRHGKSELASVRFPAWFLGRHPGAKFITTSYAATLAHKFSRRVRNLVASPLYQALFPGMTIASDASAVGYWAFRDQEGQYLAAGVGGGITGEGCDVLMIDDPVKDAEEALSKTTRDNVWEWFTSTAYTRQDESAGAIILIMTRWHEDDLAGRLLREAAEDGEQWDYVNLPAIAGPNDVLGREEGEALWPQRFPLERLRVARNLLRGGWFDALYQGEPPEALGGRYFRAFQPTKGSQPYHVWPIATVRQRYGFDPDQAFPPLPHETPGWTLWASVDGGVRDPYCVLWFARAPDRRVFVWDEQYATNVTPLRQAQRMKRRLAAVGGRWLLWKDDFGRPLVPPDSAILHLDSVRVDPNMFVPRANVGVADADVYGTVGVPVQKAFNPRVPGWRRILEHLEEMDDGLPRLVLVEGACPNLQRTLPRLTADPDDPEDVEDGQEDHAPDALRYGVNPAALPPHDRAGREMVATMGREPGAAYGGRDDELTVTGAFGAPGGVESKW
jgi:hypothetical protein